MPKIKTKLPDNLLEKLVPVLLIASIALAFAVGVLWQKVNNLEGGKSTSAVANPTTTAGNPAGSQPAAASKLSDLPALVSSIGIDKAKFEGCNNNSQQYASIIDGDYQGGIQAGVQGTPGNFIVNSKGDVWFIPGAFPYESVKPVIDLALGKGTQTTLPQGIQKLASDQASKLPKISSADHVRGNRNAQVLLVEYSDFQCPYCQRFHPTAIQILKDYGNDIGWVYRHFPLDQIHPYARPAALASECVTAIGGEEAFWKFADQALGS